MPIRSCNRVSPDSRRYDIIDITRNGGPIRLSMKNEPSTPKSGLAAAVRKICRTGFLLPAVLGMFPGPASQADDVTSTNSTPALLTMSLEQLMSIKVTSVSKKEEALSQSAAAVSVITQDDIRRSGATTIPDALRLAPGVDVGRVDAHEWAVGVRGLNDTFASSLLTLIDGRSIYSPLFSGTFWQAQDVVMEDIDRIEVVRGPGATLWGANAFNGVISIVTKPAGETQGVLVSSGSGSEEYAAESVRYGGKLDDNTFYRVYAKFNDWGGFDRADGTPANDEWWKMQTGFRLDHSTSDTDQFTVQGDLYHLSADQTVSIISLDSQNQPVSNQEAGIWQQTGGNVLGRWTHDFSEQSDFTLQAYYDGEQLGLPLLQQTRNTLDLDARQRFQLGSRQEIVWGGGYRLNASDLTGTYTVGVQDSSPQEQIYNVFGQDEISLVPEHLKLTLGTKIEHNNFTGFEWEPGARLAWTPTDKETVWASVSRAVRTPSEIEHYGLLNLAAIPAAPPSQPVPALVTVTGNANFDSEELVAYEIGYRTQPLERLSFDATAFYNAYRGLRGAYDYENRNTLPSYVQVVTVIGNTVEGGTYGGELSTTWQVADRWRLTANYSLLESDGLKDEPDNITGEPSANSVHAPEQQVSLRSSVNVTRNLDFDLLPRFVGRTAASGINFTGASTAGPIPSYFTFDARLAWRVTPSVELSLAGQNLVESPHREFNPTFISAQATQITRSVFGQLVWKF